MNNGEGVASDDPGVRRAADTHAALRCQNLSKSFGGISAVSDVTFHVAEGELVALIGPNGAGKTTVFNCLTGFARPDSGRVWLGGHDVTLLGAARIARRGAVRTFQSIRMFEGMSVLESLLVAQTSRYTAGVIAGVLRLPKHRREMAVMHENAARAMELLHLTENRHHICTDLPLLTQRKIEVARAMLVEPQVLLLDEPSAGATPTESAELADVIRELNRQGTSILLIEHNVPFVASLATHVEVMNFGRVVASGTPEAIQDNEVVREIYLGSR
jgi:branched-chain amino acid transport system ATP-binding protein